MATEGRSPARDNRLDASSSASLRDNAPDSPADHLSVENSRLKKAAHHAKEHAKKSDREIARLQVELFAQIEELSGTQAMDAAEPSGPESRSAPQSQVEPSNRSFLRRLSRSWRVFRKANEPVAYQMKNKLEAATPVAHLRSDTPRVHILVTPPGRAEILSACIVSLDTTVHEVLCRVTVASDTAPDPALVGVEYANADSTLAALDAAIESYGSELVVVLAGDIIAQDGWLDATFSAFERFADAGAVTGLIQDNKRQTVAAGSSIDHCGRLSPRCAGDTVDSIDGHPVQPVAAPSCGFVAIRRTDWAQIVDRLADDRPFWSNLLSVSLALADAGRRIYLQPRAAFMRPPDRAIEASHVTDGWQEALHRHHARQSFEYRMLSVTPLAVAHDIRSRVVFIDELIPTPKQDSGSVDAVWFIRMFLAWGCDVVFIPVYEYADTTLKADFLRQIGVDVRLAQGIAGIRAEIGAAAQTASLVILNRITVARAYLGFLRRKAPRAKVVFNTVDLHFLREERFAFLHSRAEALDAAFLLKRDEVTTTARSDATMVVSSAEEGILRDLVPNGNIHHIPIPRLPAPSKVPFDARRGIVFVGGFLHAPNVDAVKFLVEDIWPLVRARLPHALLRIVGSNATDAILALDNPGEGIDVVGYVEDLASVLDHVRLSVAPLRFGAGVKGKVVSSLMHGVPCVLSPIANEGMGFQNGKEILECRTPAEFADAIVNLHEDMGLWCRLAEAGLVAASATYSVENVAMRMANLLGSIDLDHLTKNLPAGAFDTIG